MDASFRSKSFISLFFFTFLLYLNSGKPAQALEEGDCFNTSTVVITGSITDSSGISDIAVTVDGNTPTAFDIDNGNWTATFNGLGDGPHTLVVTGTDACGSGNTATTDPLGFEVDTAAAVAITEPVDGATVGTVDLQVTGTADSDITSVSLIANQGTWTDANPVVSGGVWSSTLQGLVAGSVLKIRAAGTDNCGNIGRDSVTARVLPFVWFVDDTATGNNDGSSWKNAFTTVQLAVTAASTGDWIWVAEGTYTNSPASTASVLTMKDGVEIYGGFDATEVLLSERGNPAAHPTMLDGENTSYHVVISASNARLEGFIVRDGNANGGGVDDNGGGIYNDALTNLVVANCAFGGNTAISSGGGMYNSGSSPIITHCIFIGNSAANGGGMLNAGSPTITNCIFINNSASNYGGGICNGHSSPKIINCTFSGNSATVEGGGIYNFNSSPSITNCILWGDLPEEIYDESSTPTVTYSDIQGGYPGTGNINANPMFVTGPGPVGDYYLSQPPDQGSTSPCVNTGSKTADKLGLDDRTTSTNGDLDTGIVDMGYHYLDTTPPDNLTASPPGGSYCPPSVSVTLSCDDLEATIYYTTDGSGPTTASPVYAGPIDISMDTTLKFMAVDICGNQAGTVTEIYDIDMEAPTGLAASPAGGSYCPATVSLSASDGSPYTIYYTLDGSGPTTASPVYTGPIDISVDTTLKFMAVDACGNQSGTVTAVYTIDSTSPGNLTALPPGGSYCPTSVTLSCDDPSATIYYTLDGSEPSTASPVYLKPIDISADATLKFMAVDVCGNQSGTVTEVYTIDSISPGNLTATPPGGSYCPTSVTLSCDDPGATIYYTTDGSRPNPPDGNVYTGPIYISEFTVLKFMAEDDCGNQSGTETEVYDIDDEPPTGLAANPAGGSYCAIKVSLSASDGTIYYTTDGSGPTTGSPVYTGPIDISADTTLKFMAVDACSHQSSTVTEVYDIDDEAVVSITYPADGVTIFAGDIWFSGTADNDITTVTVTSDQGHKESSPVYAGGNWSVVLTGVTVPSIAINASGTDNCGNTGNDLINVFVYSEPTIWYVNDDAMGAGTGLSWTDAFTAIQDAADAAAGGEWIWVAEGTYASDSTAPVLTMKGGVEIYGGFTGTETDLSDRGDPTDHPTVLDGEDTSYHVVIGASNARLDGFIVTGGNADGGGVDDNGGGIYNDSVTNLMVANCTFSNNSAYWAGGGIYNYESSPIITNCVFSDNSARYGGGISNEDNSSPAITNSTFISNSAIDAGGGIDNYENSSPTILNCSFSGNSAAYGGGMCNENNSSPIITNCIMWGDLAATGAEIYTDLSSTPIVTYSDIEGGYGGEGNINANPLFVGYPDLRLQRGSPCVDTGTADGAPSYDLDGKPRPILCGYDMGAYEHYRVPNWFVDVDATGNNDGTSWEDAFTTVQAAVNVSITNDIIFVAEGMYTSGTTAPVLTMKYGVEIYGGFTGTETDLSDRGTPATHPTVLDGENISYHVVIGASNARLDGFIVTGGNANGSLPDDIGGGMYNPRTTGLAVVNCTFSGNSADNRGGGMYNWHSSLDIVKHEIVKCIFKNNTADSGGGMYNGGPSSSLEITNCSFSGNSAEYVSMGSGGGMYNDGPSPTITNCTFSGNSADNRGGGMYNQYNSSPTITNCTFSGNSADHRGGGISSESSTPEITNCNFSGNTATNDGGGISNENNSSPTITNCTFADNSSSSGGGMYNSSSSPEITNCIFNGNWADYAWGGGMFNYSSSPEITNCSFSSNYADERGGGMHNYWGSSPTITNCIMWGDTAPSGPEIYNESSSPTVTYSDVAGGYAGVGNINADPLFVTGPDGDYYLSQTAAGQGSDSPCVDAGSDTAENLGMDDKTTRTDGVPDTGIVDMGYHYQP